MTTVSNTLPMHWSNFLACVLLLAIPGLAEAQFSYTVNSDATVTITGYTGPGGDVLVPSTIQGLPVTTIGTGAFQSSAAITRITLTDTIVNVGDSAFSGCSGLGGVTFWNNVTNLGATAFSGCVNLTFVQLPKSLPAIGGGVLTAVQG